MSSLSPLTPFPICLGTGDLGAGVSRQASYDLLDAYVAHGGNFLDTALVYSDWVPGERSRSEKLIGEWMQARRNRASLVLATKGAHPSLESMHIPRLSPAEIESDLENSLRNLRTDVIDLYWLHRDDPARPVEEIIETLNRAARAGKVRLFGCSNWRVERLHAANDFAARSGLQGFAATQVMWSLARINPAAIGDPTLVVMDEALWNYHRQTNLAAIPFSATANGLFNKLAQGLIANLSSIPQRFYADEENLRRSERIHRLACEKGLSITQVVLGYLLAQPFPTYPIIGPKRVEQLIDSLSAVEASLTIDDICYLARGSAA